MAEESPRSLHHKHHRRPAFGAPHPERDLARRDGHAKRGEQVEEARDPSARLRDRRDEHVEAGQETPAARRRDEVAHWERANAMDRRRERRK
jgi:hypothetical protein